MNQLLLAEAVQTEALGFLNLLPWLLGFMLLGFLTGYLIWRNLLLGDTFEIEQENRRVHAAFKKREHAYLENRKNITSILGQDSLKRR